MASGHYALPQWLLHMGMETVCTAKMLCIIGHGDTLHSQVGFHVCTLRYFALPKRLLCMGTKIVCSAKQAAIYGHGHILRFQKGMETGTTKRARIYEHGDTMHCQQGSHIWACGHYAMPQRPL